MDEDSDAIELEIPLFIELKSSNYATNDLGAFSRTQLTADQFIGSYKGKTRKTLSQCADPNYFWTILSSRQLPLFYIDASDPKDSNWLRFIRSTTDASKYNVVCMQQNQKINYFTMREIKPGEELVSYLPHKKKRPKSKNYQNLTYKLMELNENLERIVETDEDAKKTNKKATQSSEIVKSKEATTDATLKELDKIEINSLSDDAALNSETNNFLYNTCFSLEINKKKNLTRRLFKCDLCTYSNIIDTKSNDDRLIKFHIQVEHLVDRTTDDANKNLNNEAIVKNVISNIIDVVETNQSSYTNLLSNRYAFKCNQCKSDSFDSKHLLMRHLIQQHFDLINKLKCFYCSKLFDTKHIKDYFTHLKLDHKQFIINDLLLNKKTFNDKQFDYAINWNEYFAQILNNETVKNELNRLNNPLEPESQTKIEKSNKQANKPKQPNEQTISSSLNTNSVSNFISSTSQSKTWTCQMCKKQFDQRIDLSKHQCIELNLRLLKKKKEIRKKKWREAHWKRKIDLSYIETTSLTQLSQNIADNLSFCVDGTVEDLKSYSREIKDYLNTELGTESHLEMFLKSCYPDIYEQTKQSNSRIAQSFDVNFVHKSNSYFTDSSYQPAADVSNLSNGRHCRAQANQSNTPNYYQCKTCRAKFSKISELIKHQRDKHNLNIKTTFDSINTNTNRMGEFNINSPVGYFSTDPYSYVVNMQWDQHLKKKCQYCASYILRSKFNKHSYNCQIQKQLQEQDRASSDAGQKSDDVEIIIFSANTDSQPAVNSIPTAEASISDEIKTETLNVPVPDESLSKKTENIGIIEEIIGEILNTIECKRKEEIKMEIDHEDVDSKQVKKRPKRSAQEIIEDQLGSNNILTGRKRLTTSPGVSQDQHATKKVKQENLEIIDSRLNSSKTPERNRQANVSKNSNVEKPLRLSDRLRKSPKNTHDEESDEPKSKSTPDEETDHNSKDEDDDEIASQDQDDDNDDEANSEDSSDDNEPLSKFINTSKKSNSTEKLAKSEIIKSKLVSSRKIHACEKCELEFTSSNSVQRHQEKSCLRVKVIEAPLSNSSFSAKANKDQTKKMCPICSSVFYNTHRLSIHIYKHHKNLLGPASLPPTKEAKRLHDKQLQKLNIKPTGRYADAETDQGSSQESSNERPKLRKRNSKSNSKNDNTSSVDECDSSLLHANNLSHSLNDSTLIDPKLNLTF